MNRETGILLHPTSLPGPDGIGDLGSNARAFIDYLQTKGHRIWQVLPLNYPGFGDSPYNSLSAFAGNPSLISMDDILANGLLTQDDLAKRPVLPTDKADFPAVSTWKTSLLRKAFARFTPDTEYSAFCAENALWLEDFVLFLALKGQFKGTGWNTWSTSFRRPDTARAMKTVSKLQGEMGYHRFVQYIFTRQWNALHAYAKERGIEILGDLPIYVAYDSADVWAHRECFRLDAEGYPLTVAGVPPDYFSATGQLWGNPIYHWEHLRQTDYSWWLDRLGHLSKIVDRIRIDHFIGFVRYWEIPFGEDTAVNGHYVNGPAYDFFDAVMNRFPGMRIIAEDLGIITPEVVALKTHYGFPGMKVLHFLFYDNKSPIDFEENCIAYTGTHDNDTTLGWYRNLPDHDREAVHRYLPTSEATVVHDLIDLAMRSPARTVIIPMQDILGLGSESRMNLPGTSAGNWAWRMTMIPQA